METILEPQSLAGTSLEELMREMLVRVGEDPERDGLRDRPERMERSMLYLTKGYQENPIEARHLCMMMRSVEKQHSSTITSSMLDAFREKETRDEFLALIRSRHSAF